MLLSISGLENSRFRGKIIEGVSKINQNNYDIKINYIPRKTFFKNKFEYLKIIKLHMTIITSIISIIKSRKNDIKQLYC